MSNVQFNLLPDVKLRNIHAEQSRNRVVSIAVGVSAVCVAIFVILLFSVYGVQKKQLSDANTQLNNGTSQLEAIPNINKALTIQNQLFSLVSLHQSKHISSRLFTYLSQVTPANASVGSLNVDLVKDQMTLAGTADSQATVNTFIDTLKFTQYKVASGSAVSAFPSVLESAFSINSANVSYSLTVQFDPKLFANNLTDSAGAPQAPTLQVPDQATTRATSPDSASGIFNSSSSSTGRG